MSDPVSNAEIEDVLSSIRRLVSVDHRGEAGLGVKVERQNQVSHEDDQDIENDASLDDEVDPADTPDVSIYAESDDAPEDTAKGIELGTTGVKLVLTPALRVNEEGREEDPLEVGMEDETEDEPDFASDDQQHAEHGFDDPDYHDEHEILGEGDDPLKAPEQGSDFVRLRPEAKKDWVTGDESEDVIPKEPLGDNETWPEDELQDDNLDAELDAISADDEAEDWTEEDLEDDAPNAEPEQPEEPIENELEARIAEVEAAVAARTEQWDPDSAEQDDYAGGEVEPLPWEDHGEDTEVAVEETVEEVSPEEVEAIEEAVVLDEPVEPAVDAFAEAMSEAASTPSEEPTPTPEPLNLADVAQADDVTEIVSDAVTESAVEAAADAAWYSEDTVIDEDTLRDLVSEIVRQELQGALGERITRNVRKLVRREIHRAMMGQDYE